MLPRMWSQLPCMNMAVNQLTPHGSGPWQAPVTVHDRTTRGTGRAQVRQLVEQPHGEVREDERDVDVGEAPRGDAVGERDHEEPGAGAAAGTAPALRSQSRSTTLMWFVTPVTP
jgi:hypothetical protein